MCTTCEIWPRKKEDSAKIITVKKSPWCNNVQKSKEQRSTVDSRRCLTNFKMSVSHSMSAVLTTETVCLTTVKCQSVSQWQQSWDSLSNYCQLLNQVFKVSSGTCQQFVEYAVKINNIFGFSTFTIVV